MQNSQQAFVGLDIGSSKVACVVGVVEPDTLEPSVVGVATSRNFGVRKGAVVDIDETAQAIERVLEEATRMSGQDIKGATISVGGVHLKSINSKGVIAVGGINRPISSDDVARVEEAATVVQLPANREIIQVFARHYRLDGQEYLKDPVGMNGVRLEVDAHIITAATPAIRNLHKSLYQAGLTINQQEAPVLAAARAVLDKRQREHGTLLIDLGASTTSLAIFEEGEILHTATLGIGSGHITNDLAIGFRTDIDTAEQIKRQHTDVSAGHRPHGATLKTTQGEALTIDLGYAVTIAHARLEEIFELIVRELEKAKRVRKLPGGALLIGGGANQKGLVAVAKDLLDLPVTIGKARGFTAAVHNLDDPAYAVAAGLMLDDMFLSHIHQPKLTSLTAGKLGSAAKSMFRFLKP